jgi:hypothetical protein
MARFGLVGPSYRSQSVNADCQALINLYVETIESGQGKGPLVLYGTPGLTLLYNLGTAGLRGEITAQGRTFVVAGTVLWELLAPSASPNKISRGNVVSDGLPVSMASGASQVLIASAGNLYCFQLVAGTTLNATGVLLAANSLTLLPQYNNSTGYGLLANVAQVAYSDGFFISLIANSGQLQASNPLDGSSWQGVSQTIVSVFADNVVSIYFHLRYLFVQATSHFRTTSCRAATSTREPLQRSAGRRPTTAISGGAQTTAAMAFSGEPTATRRVECRRTRSNMNSRPIRRSPTQ